MGSTGKVSSNAVRNENQSLSTPAPFRRVNTQTVSNWVDSQDASNFLGSAPESITVGGVKFNWIGGNMLKAGDVYTNSYQANEQASNGEYPVIEVVVNRKRVRGGYRWSFDRSTFGTGLR